MIIRIVGILRALLLVWSGIVFLPAWLVTIRGIFDGQAYAWGVTERIKGRGIRGHYFLAPLAALYGLTMLWLGWRGSTRPFHLMLLAWHVPLGAAASIAARRNREALRFQGDTLGVDVSLAVVAPVVLAGVAAGSVALTLLDQNDRDIPGWSVRNQRLLNAALGAIPLQAVLLRIGGQDGLIDRIGVILTILQWGAINLSFAAGGHGVGSLEAQGGRVGESVEVP